MLFGRGETFYYPVDQFFPLLFEEREQALIALLSDLVCNENCNFAALR